MNRITWPDSFHAGDRVRVKTGVFEGMQGEVLDVIAGKGMVRVLLTVLGRPVPVELEPWEVERSRPPGLGATEGSPDV